MARLQTARSNGRNHSRASPWRASRKRQGYEYFLGYFATREDAEQREKEFDRVWPPRT